MSSYGSDTWKSFIEDILISKNNYKTVSKKIKSQIEEVTYMSSDENLQTHIIISYYTPTDDLIALRHYNPTVRGYSEFSKNEYLYSLQFSSPRNYGKPGLEYIHENKKAIKVRLKKGITGKEVQYIKDGKVLKVELYLLEGDDSFSYKYRFSRAPMIDILLNKNEKEDGMTKKIINLKEVFPGLVVE